MKEAENEESIFDEPKKASDLEAILGPACEMHIHSKTKYVIYAWQSRSLGHLTCARAFVNDTLMTDFITKIRNSDVYYLIDIAESI